MGRIQKKKKSGAKKKRQVGEDKPTATPVKHTAAVPAKEARRQSASAGGKGPPRHPLIPGKIRNNYIDKAMQFLREVMMELKKVTWPSRKQTTGSTIVMIILVAIISLFLGMVDFGLTKLIQTALQ